MTTPSAPILQAACKALAAADPALAKAYAAHGLPVWRSSPPEYEMLARTVTYQLISTIAAAAIWARIQSAIGHVTPATILAADPQVLRDCGLSRPKIGHYTTIAEAITTDTLNLQRVCTAPLPAARKELLAIKGIGPWTAELFLLYARGELNALPIGDVGLMEAHKLLSGDETRMDAKSFTAHAENWKPYRGVAAHLLWGWLNDQRAAKKPSAS